jgi:ribose 5-phosphate isomerase B
MKVFAGSDHAGFALKQVLIERVQRLGLDVVDLGTDSIDSCDYPDYAHAVAKAVLATPGSMGLLICGSGIGISITANRYPGIRAALCRSSYEARLAREHNDANILALGARITGVDLAIDTIETFLSTSFLGERHIRRVAKIERSSS